MGRQVYPQYKELKKDPGLYLSNTKRGGLHRDDIHFNSNGP